MKSVNGNNKLERQVNKALKYVGVDLKEISNQYLEIVNFDKENTFIAFGEDFRVVKNGELIVIDNANMNKPIFKKSWGTIFELDNYFIGKYCIFKSYGEEEHKVLSELAAGKDGIWKLEDFLKDSTRIVRISKN